jgi:hypothetical protein
MWRISFNRLRGQKAGLKGAIFSGYYRDSVFEDF